MSYVDQAPGPPTGSAVSRPPPLPPKSKSQSQSDDSMDPIMSSSGKVKKNQEDSLDSIPSPSPSVKIQIIGRKVYLSCKGKTLLGVVNKLFVFKSLLTMPSNVLPLHLKQTFPLII